MSDEIPLSDINIGGPEAKPQGIKIEGNAGDLSSPICSQLYWNKGPANGGGGTAGGSSDDSRWWDGDTLLVIVETNSGRDVALIHVSADEGCLSFQDSNGDSWGWQHHDISWWAKIEEGSLPMNREITHMED